MDVLRQAGRRFDNGIGRGVSVGLDQFDKDNFGGGLGAQGVFDAH